MSATRKVARWAVMAFEFGAIALGTWILTVALGAIALRVFVPPGDQRLAFGWAVLTVTTTVSVVAAAVTVRRTFR